MRQEKNKLKALRRNMERAGIDSIAELARRVPCSRVAIYFALERPSRFPRVRSRLEELLND